MKLLRVLLPLFLFLGFSKGFSEEEFVDLRTFVQERTHQYPLLVGRKICLITPLRTGSTFVYNVLRFLFEYEDHRPWLENRLNLVVKSHHLNALEEDVIYVVTMRNPIDACVSLYRVNSTMFGEEKALETIDEIVQLQVNSFYCVDRLIYESQKVIVLKYEEFVDDFDFLFDSLESGFFIFIDGKDREVLKRSLNKTNVEKNISGLTVFSQYDEYSLFHGCHIDKRELSNRFLQDATRLVISRLRPYADMFQKWGYMIPESMIQED